MIRRSITLPLATAAALAVAAVAPQEVFAQSAERQLDNRSFIDAAQAVLPSVANIFIETEAETMEEMTPEDWAQLFDPRSQGGLMPVSISGSGVIIHRDGNMSYVLTNNHVVARHEEGKTQIKLTFHQRPDGSTEYSRTTEIVGEGIRVVGRDQLSDLAVIEFVRPEGFVAPPVEFADSDKVEVGENIIALGNPLDLNHTVTRGIISAKSRYLGRTISIERLLQTDAVIQPGSSGGPLVNLDGKIVGINNAIMTRSGLWQGTSFAIPSNDASRISRQLIELGRVTRGYLGVNMKDVIAARDVIDRYDLSAEQGGVIIENVVSNSPADIAGIHVDDVVLRIDDQPVRDSEDMLQIISRKDVDTTVSLDVVRLTNDETPIQLTVQASLAERPNETIIENLHVPQVRTIPDIQRSPEAQSSRDFGLIMEPYFEEESRRAGMLVTDVVPGSLAEAVGLQAGDLVTALNGRSVRSIGDFRAASTVPTTQGHRLRYLRDGDSKLATIPGDSPMTRQSPGRGTE